MAAGNAPGRPHVQEERSRRLFGLETQGAEGVRQHRQAAAVLVGDLVGDFGMLQRIRGGHLDGLELAGVEVVLGVGEGAHHQLVAANPGQAPAGHVEGFGHAVDFHPDVPGARNGEKAQRPALEHQRGVGGVLHHQQLVLLGEGYDFFEEFWGGHGAGRVVRVVEQEDFGLCQLLIGEAVEVGQVVVLFQQRQVVDVAAVPAAVGAEDRVAGHRRNNGVARVDEAGRQESQGVLGADGVGDLAGRVEVHAVDARHVLRHGLLELRHAVVGIAAVFGHRRLLAQRVHDARIGHAVRLANAHVDQRHVGTRRDGGIAGAADFLELVYRGVFAVVPAADALGEQLL